VTLRSIMRVPISPDGTVMGSPISAWADWPDALMAAERPDRSPRGMDRTKSMTGLDAGWLALMALTISDSDMPSGNSTTPMPGTSICCGIYSIRPVAGLYRRTPGCAGVAVGADGVAFFKASDLAMRSPNTLRDDSSLRHALLNFS